MKFANLQILLVAGCLGLASAAGAQDAAGEPSTTFEPPEDGFDWLQLTSGEWLKGELIVFTEDEVEFDSDILDELTIDGRTSAASAARAPTASASAAANCFLGSCESTTSSSTSSAGGAPQSERVRAARARPGRVSYQDICEKRASDRCAMQGQAMPCMQARESSVRAGER